MDIRFPAFLTSAALYPGRFTLGGKTYGTHWTGGWFGPRAGLDSVTKGKKSGPLPCRMGRWEMHTLTPEGKRPFGTHRCRWEDNIKSDLNNTGYEDVSSL